MEWLPMVGVGIAWASILSIYAMLSGSLPSDKMGYYMGVFNFFIVIPVSCRIHFRVLVSKFLIMNLFMHFDWRSINDSSWNYRTYH
jgi:hypothetical protein